MAGELRIKTAKPLVKGQILNEAGETWDGSSAMVEESSLTDAEWTAALITLTEGATDDATDTDFWRANWPGALTKNAFYDVLFYSGASPGPGDLHFGQQHDPTEFASAKLDRNADLVESQRGSHTWQGNAYYVTLAGNDSTGDGSRALPYLTIQAAHDDLITTNNHDVIFLGPGTHTTAATITLSKNYFFIRGPGRNCIVTRTGNGDTLAITGDGVEITGARVGTANTGSGHGIKVTSADFARIHHVWFLATQGDGVHLLRASNCQIHDNDFDGTGVGGSGQGIHIVGTGGLSNGNAIFKNEMHGTSGTAILIEQGTTNDTLIYGNDIHDAGGWGINIGASSNRAVLYDNVLGNNSSGNINDGGSNSIIAAGVAPTANENADAQLARSINNANPASKEYTLRFLIAMLMNSNTVDNDGYITVYDTTDSEIAQLPITTNAAANPMTGIS